MKKIAVIIAEISSNIGIWIIVACLVLAIPIYMSMQIVQEEISFFITELLIFAVLGIIAGLLFALKNIDSEALRDTCGIIAFVAAIVLTIINYRIMFDETRFIYKVLAFLSMIPPSIVYALLFFAISCISHWIVAKLKSA